MLEEEKEAKRAYEKDRYIKMTEDEKIWLKEYQKNYQVAKLINNKFFVWYKNECKNFKFSWIWN